MTSPTRREHLALALILLVAAGLRFAGLTHHLARGAPMIDERHNFVDPVLHMWQARTPNPTVYAGYPGFFNWLLFLPVGIGHSLGDDLGAYAAARGLVALFGTLSVFLAYRVARPLGAPAALLAAALLAVARVEVRSAHQVTPDVLVGTALLAALWALARLPPRRGAVAAGVLLGLATAVKYTGLLVAPAVVVALAVERRLRADLPRLAAAALLSFVLAAPYALLAHGPQGSGLAKGLETYYGADAAGNRFALGEGTALGSVFGALLTSVGPLACLLALAGLVLHRPLRPLLAPAAVVGAAIVVMAPANLVNPRHVIPAVVALVLLAAAGLAALLARVAPAARGALGATLAAAVLFAPASESARLLSRYLRRPAIDQAAEWIETHRREPGLVVTSFEQLRLDPERFEVRSVKALPSLAQEALLRYDLLVSANRSEPDRLRGFTPLARFDSEDDDPALAVTILQPAAPPPLAAAPRPVRTSASEAAAEAGAAWDGDPASRWRAESGDAVLEAEWSADLRPALVELEAGQSEGEGPQRFRLWGSVDGQDWHALSGEPLRPTRPARQRPHAPHGQVYAITPPRPLRWLRVGREDPGPWSVAAIRVWISP